MKEKIAFVLGASGSVGSEVLQVLMQHADFQKVVSFVRKPLAQSAGSKLEQKVVAEMNPIALGKAVGETLATQNSAAEIMAFSALGVGGGTAKLTIDEHRAVDVFLNQAFAQALKGHAQVKYFALLSSIGANPMAKTTGSGAAGMARYLRVKGESEEAVKNHGPATVGIFRPAMIRGSVHTPKIFDVLAPVFDCVIPKRYHSIRTQQIAQAMVAASLTLPHPAQETYTYAEMMSLVSSRF